MLKAAGVSLALVFVVGIALIGGHKHVADSYEHVVVRIYNANDLSIVSVNCRVAKTVSRGHAATIDLGWLKPTDNIYISTLNRGHGAAWGYRLQIDGKWVTGDNRGAASSAGFAAPEHSVVMARGFEASGDPLGNVGCVGPMIVSPDMAEYSRVPEASQIGQHPLPRWQTPTFPFALIDGIGAWAPLALAALGFLVGPTRREVRDFVRERWQWSFVLGLVALTLAIGAFDWNLVLVLAEMVGVALIPVTAYFCLREACSQGPETSGSDPKPPPRARHRPPRRPRRGVTE